ncbi:MAG: hypothetical protein AMXMBFR82_00950 [Candidatus Hydrogenedentota bacterium]
MTIAENLLAELDQESQATRRILERIPEDKLGWSPAEKSMTIGQLGMHIAQGPGQVAEMATKDSLDFQTFDGRVPAPSSTKEILDTYSSSLATARQLMSQMDDARMLGTWRAMMGEKELMAMPRAGLIRMIMLNHQYHHRGQLSVYLRLLGESVPSVYGPTADEAPDFLAEATA